ncbi:MAG: lysine 2,3-aminomutase [Anaerolineae bacterium]|nr:lysine 2,3-aminomutase [Anaerolineae bacterium]
MQPYTYRAITRHNIHKVPQYDRLKPEQKETIQIVSAIFPFRTNPHVVEHLIDWDDIPNDPIFQLTFPQRGMLKEDEYDQIRQALDDDHLERQRKVFRRIRMGYNPHPAGQKTHNVPRLNGERIPGLQHKYAETVLYFPAQGQTCHAYCSYCFRWAQFIGDQDLRFAARSPEQLVAYLRAKPQVTDVLFTGGDPAVMKTKLMRRHIEPLLDPSLAHVQTIRIGTKALSYWPYRFVTDPDADDLLRLFEEIIASGRHLAIMAHFSHQREMEPPIVHKAIRRLRDIGVEIRMQAPLMRRINDDPDVWATMWREGVRLGMIPYYMFISRDTGPQNYFEVSLAQAWRIFRNAYSQVSGLGRTVRGPVMSAMPGKVMINGLATIRGKQVFVLQFLQGRDAKWVGRPFLARFDPAATWLTDLQAAFTEEFPHQQQIEYVGEELVEGSTA